jgi:AcrR family transcriptional regulator
MMIAPRARISAARAAAKRPVDTRERIIQGSILLFNRKGLRSVPVDQIAKALKISPGNLTYHFPRKADLIGATLGVMKERLQAALAPPTPAHSARFGAEYLVNLYRTLWDFRFFFNALTYVLTIAELKREYSEFRDWSIRTVESDLQVFCDLGYFLPPAEPNSFLLLAENMWSLWLNWLRTQQLRTPLATTPDHAALYECALHDWSLCQPWMRLDYARELLQAIDEALPGRGKLAAAAAPS